MMFRRNDGTEMGNGSNPRDRPIGSAEVIRKTALLWSPRPIVRRHAEARSKAFVEGKARRNPRAGCYRCCYGVVTREVLRVREGSNFQNGPE